MFDLISSNFHFGIVCVVSVAINLTDKTKSNVKYLYYICTRHVLRLCKIYIVSGIMTETEI